MAAKNKLKNNRGQATIETALSLPFIIWMIYYMFNAFYFIHSSHVGQKSADMNLNERLNYRAKFIMDDVDNRLHGQRFMSVQYLEGDGFPKRKILFGPNEIRNTVGICREPGC